MKEMVTDDVRMAYIDSEIAKRRYNGLQVSALVEPVSPQSGSAETVVRGKSKEFDNVQRAQATMGKLQEVELGDEARDKNVERTDKARRRLEGEMIEEETKAPRKQKVRLGRDGKPWRGRKKRASEDIARDKLVEDILRENRRTLRAPSLPYSTRMLTSPKWIFMKSQCQRRHRSTTTKPQMIKLQTLSGETSLMRSRLGSTRRRLRSHLRGMDRMRRRKR